MSEVKLDGQDGGAAPGDLKPPTALGLVVDNPEGVLNKNKELLAELNKAKSKLNAFEQAEAQKREQEAKDKGEYQKLLDEREKENKTLKQQIKESRIQVQAIQKGLVDPDYVALIASQVSDDMANLDEVLDGLKVKKPFLFGQTATPFTPPADTDKGKAPASKPGRIWTEAEVAALSKEDFAKYQKEIISQQVQGLVKSI